MYFKKALPDVVKNHEPVSKGRLKWVGMTEIEIPLRYKVEDEEFRVKALADALVSLDDENAKGIHMSRLFLDLEDTLSSETLSPTLIKRALNRFLESHNGCSKNSRLNLKFDYMVKRPALLSSNKGWRSYPISIKAKTVGSLTTIDLEVRIVYSSTCPCSAALARQAIQENFITRFPGAENVTSSDVHQWLGTEEGVVATPHAQRSHADVLIRLQEDVKEFPILELIDRVEKALGTPVQAAVKREDEQEFAKRNAQNLMFSEDAARKIKSILEGDPIVSRYRVRVRHFESLHAHNVTAIATSDFR